jgi:hypothetical protein
MAKCANCGKKGFRLKVNDDSLCEECARPKDYTDTVTGALQGFWEIPFGTIQYHYSGRDPSSTWEEMVKAKSNRDAGFEYEPGEQIPFDSLGGYSELSAVGVTNKGWKKTVLFAGYPALLVFYFINKKFYRGTVKIGEHEDAAFFSALYKKYSNPSGDKKEPVLWYVNSYTWKFENGSYIKFYRHYFDKFLKSGTWWWKTEYVDGPLIRQVEELKRVRWAEYEAKKAKEAARLTTEL